MGEGLTNEIGNLSSDSEDEIDLHEIARQIIIPPSDAMLPEKTESQFRVQMMGNNIMEKIMKYCPKQFKIYIQSLYRYTLQFLLLL